MNKDHLSYLGFLSLVIVGTAVIVWIGSDQPKEVGADIGKTGVLVQDDAGYPEDYIIDFDENEPELESESEFESPPESPEELPEEPEVPDSTPPVGGGSGVAPDPEPADPEPDPESGFGFDFDFPSFDFDFDLDFGSIFDGDPEEDSDVDPTPAPVADVSPVSDPEFTKVRTMDVTVYFGHIASALDGSRGSTCSSVSSVSRTIRATRSNAAVLNELLEGPTVSEREMGYYTQIPSGTQLNSFEIRDGKVYLDFNSAIQSGVERGSCQAFRINAQITKTVEHLTSVRDIVITVNGKVSNVFRRD